MGGEKAVERAKETGGIVVHDNVLGMRDRHHLVVRDRGELHDTPIERASERGAAPVR
jgi:hypothetical protein